LWIASVLVLIVSCASGAVNFLGYVHGRGLGSTSDAERMEVRWRAAEQAGRFPNRDGCSLGLGLHLGLHDHPVPACWPAALAPTRMNRAMERFHVV
jgi:hypothetical protein